MADWPYEELESLQNFVGFLEQAISNMDVLGALRNVNVINETICEVASKVLEIAASETKITQKDLAVALGVPPSTLRGLRGRRS